MAGTFAPNLRISFAIPKRLLSVTWRTNSEVTLGNAQGHAMRTPVRLLLDQSLSITRERTDTAKRQWFAMGMLWFIIASYGNAVHYHRVTWNNIASALEC